MNTRRRKDGAKARWEGPACRTRGMVVLGRGKSQEGHIAQARRDNDKTFEVTIKN